MTGAGLTPAAQLAAWREQGWADLDPVAFVFMEALARRTATQEGQARQRLEARMAALIADYAARIGKAARAASPGQSGHAGQDTPAGAASTAPAPAATARPSPHTAAAAARPAPAAPSPTALAALRDDLVDRAAAHKSALPWAVHYPELPLLDEFQQLWSRVSASMRVQESQFQVPDNAGPLNSSHLVHRSLTLMRELAPGYLQHFLAYVDILSWLEPMVIPAIPQRDSARAGAKTSGKTSGKTPAKAARKASRARPRGKQDA